MHSIKFGLAALALTLAGAQRAAARPPAIKTYAGSAEVQALIAKAAAEIKPSQPIIVQPLIALAPYAANLEYRKAPVPPAVHIHEAEFFYVIDGGGTLVTGGHLVDPIQPNPQNRSGSSITGGSERHVGKGDFLIIPEDTPHWFSKIDDKLVMMSIHVPRPVPQAGQ